ncbi:MAG: Dabb family protein [Verrucomicrobiaceae bacterium]|nr:Dabb family protein [Verrucomicrobiaceae bacterium]
MISYLSLFQLKPEVTPERLETMMAQTRVLLLRVPEVLAVKTGKRVNPSDEWPWFVQIEVESMDKLAICQDDPYYFKFREEVLKPHIAEQETTAFEMEPQKNVKYS